jgi:hypothetical protein
MIFIRSERFNRMTLQYEQNEVLTFCILRNIDDHDECSPVTAWRIVKSQGWVAKGHHWEEVRHNENKRVAG